MDEQELLEARKILGNLAKHINEEKLKDEYVKIQYLIESWLDDFEKSIFEGKTLREVLGD